MAKAKKKVKQLSTAKLRRLKDLEAQKRGELNYANKMRLDKPINVDTSLAQKVAKRADKRAMKIAKKKKAIRKGK